MSIVFNWEIAILNDYYGKLLTNNQREVLNLYYDDNLSLGEIAKIKNISRAAVRDSIAKASGRLIDIEEKLNFVKKIANIKQKIDDIILILDEDKSKLFKEIKGYIEDL